jgi:riboflavin synthase
MIYLAPMFTGIIEATGKVSEVIPNGSNRTFWIESALSSQFKVDQSICHSGVCLTVEEVQSNRHRVTAIEETLRKTTLANWQKNGLVNLERCLSLNSLVDGHLVQGHADAKGKCIKRKEKNGSWEFEFGFPKKMAPWIIEKGSVAVNGISLTAFEVENKSFRVAIIPYTFEHTNIQQVKAGDPVNLEFDMVGKYIHRYLSLQ